MSESLAQQRNELEFLQSSLEQIGEQLGLQAPDLPIVSEISDDMVPNFLTEFRSAASGLQRERERLVTERNRQQNIAPASQRPEPSLLELFAQPSSEIGIRQPVDPQQASDQLAEIARLRALRQDFASAPAQPIPGPSRHRQASPRESEASSASEDEPPLLVGPPQQQPPRRRRTSAEITQQFQPRFDIDPVVPRRVRIPPARRNAPPERRDAPPTSVAARISGARGQLNLFGIGSGPRSGEAKQEREFKVPDAQQRQAPRDGPPARQAARRGQGVSGTQHLEQLQAASRDRAARDSQEVFRLLAVRSRIASRVGFGEPDTPPETPASSPEPTPPPSPRAFPAIDPNLPRSVRESQIKIRADIEDQLREALIESGEEIPAEEQKQPPPAIENIFTEAVNHLIDTQNIAPFEDVEAGFTVERLENLIGDGITRRGLKAVTEETVDKEISNQIRAARGDTNRLLGILSTLGLVSRRLAENEVFIGPELFERILKDKIPLENPLRVRGSLAVSQEVIPELINNLFSVDLHRLQARNLGSDEITAIRRDFQADLERLEGEIRSQTETELQEREFAAQGAVRIPRQEGFIPPQFNQQTFQALQEYINTHVENNTLRLLLLNDVENRIAQDRDKIGVRLGNAPQQIIPTSANQVRILRQPLAEGIGTVLGESLRSLEERRLGLNKSDGTLHEGKTALKRVHDEDVRTLAEEFNAFSVKHQIRNPRTGQPELIALRGVPEGKEAIPDEAGFGEALFGATGFGEAEAKTLSTDEILKELDDARGRFARTEQIFSRVPIRQTDRVTGKTRDKIVEDIINLQKRDMHRRRDTLRRPMRHKVSTISRRAKLPGVEILQGQRMPIRTAPGETRMSAVPREIKINANFTLAELAKIANMLLMESGTLEDVRHQPLLDIQKGTTTIQEVVAVIVDQQKKHSGTAFSLIYVPHHVFGGMFLDGALDVIHKNRMLTNPIGGGFGDFIKGVGNIFGTIASAPLNLVGSVLGGGMHRLSADRSHRSIDAVQHGGDLRDTVFTGEHQPEPHVAASHGSNHIFRIQPFTGGRIDNTGFIDNSQVAHDMFNMYPKHRWADTPVSSFYHYR